MKDHMHETQNFPLTLFYDGGCPLCAFEMDNLRRRANVVGGVGVNGAAAPLVFVDISHPNFDPSICSASPAQMMTAIHGMRPDSTLVVGVPALRLAYQAVGLGALVAPTGWRWLAPIFDWLYALLARYRQPISRLLSPLITHFEARKAAKRIQACQRGSCTR